MYEITKEVFFHEYCPKCKNKNVSEGEDPCNECLTYPSNIESHKPMMYEPAE